MVVLIIFLVLLALLIFLLCMRVTLTADYHKTFRLEAGYLFFHFPLYPARPKKDKPPNKEKKPKKKPEAEPKPEEQTEPKPNPIKTFIANQGFEGVIQLIRDAADSLSRAVKGILRHFIIDELYLHLVVAGHDAAHCAVKYGKVCGAVFPPLGLICSKMKVKKYDADVSPDFLATFSEADFHVQVSMRPIFLIVPGVALVIRLLFKVVFKLLFSKPKAKDGSSDAAAPSADHKKPEQKQIEQGGAVS